MRITKITRQTDGRTDGRKDGQLNGWLENNSPNGWTDVELNGRHENKSG